MGMYEAESFEVQGTPYLQKEDRNALLQQVSEELVTRDASYGFKVRFHGDDQVTVVYHCFEMDIPYRLKQVESTADTCLKDWVKTVKKEFKARGGGTLKLKELKDKRESTAEKVSLNSRYYFREFRTYELG